MRLISELILWLNPKSKRKDNVITIYPEQTVTRNQPINLSEIDKDLFVHEFSKKINETTIKTVKKVDVLKDTIFCKSNLSFYTKFTHLNGQSRREKLKRLLLLLAPYNKTYKGVWIIDNWSINYFHWFTDAIPRLIAAEKFIDTHAVLLPEQFRTIKYINQSLEILNFKTVFFNPSKRMHVEQIVLPSHTAPTGNYNKELINNIRKKFVRENNLAPNKKIYISRQNAHHRKIANEPDVILLLESYGYEIHFFEQYDFYKQVNLMKQASHLVGLHGAGLTNMLFMPDKGKILELRNINDAHNNCYFSLASDLNHDYYYLLNEGDSSCTHSVNIRVNLLKLKQILEKMQ